MTSFPPKMRDPTIRKPIIAPKHTNGPHSNGPQPKSNGPISPRVPPMSLRHRHLTGALDGRYMKPLMQPPRHAPMQPPYQSVSVPRMDPKVAPPNAPLHSTTIPHSGRPAMGTPEWNPLLHSTMNPNSNPFEPSSSARDKDPRSARAPGPGLDTSHPRSIRRTQHGAPTTGRALSRDSRGSMSTRSRNRDHLNPDSRPFMPMSLRDPYRQASPTRQQDRREYRPVTKSIHVKKPQSQKPQRHAIQPPLRSSRDTHQTAYPDHTE